MKRLAITALLIAFPGGASAFEGSQTAGSDDDGQALLDENCLYCHDDSYITALNLGRAQWEEVLDLMIGMGMPPLEPEVQEKILDYLEEEHGPRESRPDRGRPVAGASVDSGVGDLPWAYPRYRPNPLVWKEP